MHAADDSAMGTGAIGKVCLVMYELAAAGDRIGVSELARRTRLPKTTVHRIVRTLVSLGIAEHQEGGYRAGWRLVDLAVAASDIRPSALRDRLLPHLIDLFQQTRQSVHLGVLCRSTVLCIEHLRGHRSVASPVRAGISVPAQRTALGKILLAYYDDSHRPQSLAAELSSVRREGVAVKTGEFYEGITSIAVPVWGRGQVAAAISVSAPEDTINVSQTAHILRQVAHSASRDLIAWQLTA